MNYENWRDDLFGQSQNICPVMLSNADLDSIYHSIDREKVPERFQALLCAIKTRVDEHNCEGVAE